MIDATHLKAQRSAACLLKAACSPTYRAHQRRPELQAARGLRQQRTSARHALKRGADERLQGRGAYVARHAQGQGASRRQGYDADWFLAALAKRGVTACIRSKSNRKSRSPMTLSPTSNATKSKTCSGGSKIGVPSTPDTKSPASCQLTVDSLDMRSNAEFFDLGLGKVERRTDPFAAVSRSRRSTIAARRRSAAFPVRSPGSSRHFAVHDVPYRSQDSPAQDTPGNANTDLDHMFA